MRREIDFDLILSFLMMITQLPVHELISLVQVLVVVNVIVLTISHYLQQGNCIELDYRVIEYRHLQVSTS